MENRLETGYVLVNFAVANLMTQEFFIRRMVCDAILRYIFLFNTLYFALFSHTSLFKSNISSQSIR